MEPDVSGTAISCVRGEVAGVVASLLWRQPEAYDRLLPTAKRLLADPHPSVRHEALGVCLPIWNRDKNLAVRLVVAACGHEDERVLGSRWLNHLIRHARATHLEQLRTRYRAYGTVSRRQRGRIGSRLANGVLA